MKFVCILGQLLVFIVFATSLRLLRVKDDRIIGGKSAESGQFPYQVSLQIRSKNFHYCGGSILSAKWVLTAAHCVVKLRPEHFQVVAGIVNLRDNGTRYDVSKIIMHEAYNNVTLLNDIALLRTSADIQFGKFVSSIRVGYFKLHSNYDVIVSGWGRAGPRFYPDQLQYLSLVTISNERCRRVSSDIGSGHLCTLAPSGTGVCNGDSGGALAYHGYLVGIVSGVIRCASNYPDIFTRLSAYVHWIERALDQHPLSF